MQLLMHYRHERHWPSPWRELFSSPARRRSLTDTRVPFMELLPPGLEQQGRFSQLTINEVRPPALRSNPHKLVISLQSGRGT